MGRGKCWRFEESEGVLELFRSVGRWFYREYRVCVGVVLGVYLEIRNYYFSYIFFFSYI